MKKTLPLKTWYNLEEAANRLNTSFSEDMKWNDLIPLVLNNRISIYWFGGEVFCEPCSEVEKIGEPAINLGDTSIGYNKYHFNEEWVISINTPLKLEVNKNTEIRNYIHSVIVPERRLSHPPHHLLVSDPNGRLYKVVEPYIPGLNADVNWIPHIRQSKIGYRDTLSFPATHQLGFTSDELDQFEKLNKFEQIEIPKKTDKRVINSLLKLVFGMAISKYEYNPEAKRSNTVKRIENDLNLLGVELHDDAIRSSLEAANAYIKEIRTKKP